MSGSRRKFLVSSAAALLAPAAAAEQAQPVEPPPRPFDPATQVGPEVNAATFAEAEKLMMVELTPAERTRAAQSWRSNMAPLHERRSGPRRVALPRTLAPYSICNPLIPGHGPLPQRDRFVRSGRDAGPVPVADADIAFAPVWKLSRWIAAGTLSSERLTRIYLDRIARFDGQLRAVITLTPELALEQARQADREIAAGKYRGPLHGVPWGAKDILDTGGIPTTYGAQPYRQRVPNADATVVRRLHEAGAVLIAKLSLGALCLGDVWFGGQTMNPWLPVEGSSGSSAGPAAATAAGMVAFAIGSETGGSIVAPSQRCGITGLRPTFGRVARTGAMTLCWSIDKLGPMARTVEDVMLVLQAITGPDPADLGSIPAHLEFDAGASVAGLRVGYFPSWMNEKPATEVDRAALERLRTLGLEPVAVAIPDWPYGDLDSLLLAEGAAAFEELTLNHGIDGVSDWADLFHQARFISAVDLVQTDRLRRAVALEMQKLLAHVDLLLVPSLRDEMQTIGQYTGLPCLTLRAGFVQVTEPRDVVPDPARPLPTFHPPRRVPHGVTLIGRLFDEGTIARVGLALERSLAVAEQRPTDF